jgi:hypothetical protein
MWCRGSRCGNIRRIRVLKKKTYETGIVTAQPDLDTPGFLLQPTLAICIFCVAVLRQWRFTMMRVSPPLPLSAGIAYRKQAQRASLPACDIVIMSSSLRSCSAGGYDDPLQRLHSASPPQ